MNSTEKTTIECLKILIEGHPAKIKDLLAFVGVKKERLSDWLMGKGPLGFGLLRLRVFLADSGLVPKEYTLVQEPALTFGRIVAFRIVPEQDIKKYIDYDDASLLRVLLGKGNPSKNTKENMTAFVDMFKHKLPAQKQIPNVFGQPNSLDCEKSERSLSKSLFIETLAKGIALIRPFAEAIASDEFTDEDRKKFRFVCGYENLSKTSTALNRLLR